MSKEAFKVYFKEYVKEYEDEKELTDITFNQLFD